MERLEAQRVGFRAGEVTVASPVLGSNSLIYIYSPWRFHTATGRHGPEADKKRVKFFSEAKAQKCLAGSGVLRSSSLAFLFCPFSWNETILMDRGL